MSKRNKGHIEKIMSKAGIEKAPANFTKNVMQDVFISTNEAALKDVKLTSLLKETTLEIPSDVFVSNIMNAVEAKRNIEFKPLISKKGWLTICGFFAGILVFMSIKSSPTEPSTIFAKISPYLDEAKNIFSNPFKGTEFFTGAELSPILVISLLCLSSMLLFDTLVKKRLFT